MIFLDDNFAIKTNGVSFQLIEFRRIRDVKRVYKTTSFFSMESLNAFYLESTASRVAQFESFQNSRHAILRAVENIRRTIRDVKTLASGQSSKG